MKTKYLIKNIPLHAIAVLTAVAVFSCKEDDDQPGGEPFFYIGNVEEAMTIPMDANGTVTASDATGMNDFTSGIQFDVEANGNWTLEPVDGSEPDWARLYPLCGQNEGIVKAYASPNTETAQRSVQYKVFVNGIEQPVRLTLVQDKAPAQFTLSSNNITLKTEGGSAILTVNSNVEWEIDYDRTLDWLTVSRDGNTVTFTAPKPNDTGAHLVTTVTIHGIGEYADVSYMVTITQLSVLFSDDFSWLPCTTTPPACWQTPDNSKRIDFWANAFASAVDDPAILTAWTAVDDASAAAPTFAHFNYVKLGGTSRCGNICSPAIPSIEGAINATVSWSMAGHCTAKNVRSDCNDFTVAILGPGRITEAIAHGNSTAKIATGEFTVPYNSEGKTSVCDVYLTEVATFTIGTNGYFTTSEPTGLEVWNNPDSQFAIKVEGMTAQTRIAFIGSDGDKVTMLNNWTTSKGPHSDARKCFDNFKVEID